MKKRELIQGILFIIIFFMILIPLTYIIRTNGDVKDRFTGFYAEKKNTIDTVIIGSSPVYPYYCAPKLYGESGITMYPISTNLQRPKAAIPLIEEVKKTQTPQLYIFELRMYTAADEDLVNNMAYTRGVTDNLKYSINRIKTINRLVDDKKERYTYYFDIFKYHSNWKTLFLPSQLRTLFYEYPDDLKGFVMNDKLGPSEMVDYSDVTSVKAIPADAEDTLKELLDYLQKNGDEALFVVSPYTMTEEKQQMYNYMDQIIASYGYSVLNLNDHYEDMQLDFQTDFYDYGGHVNALGAEKCTDFLEDYLSENYTWTDKREMKGYESWDDAYTLWQEEQTKAKETIQKRIEEKDYAEIEEE